MEKKPGLWWFAGGLALALVSAAGLSKQLSGKAETASDKVDEHLYEEWQEARACIGRFDAQLLDIRKYGFSLLTVLIGTTGSG